MRKVAFDLVKLYAERTESPGFAFPVDGPWQNELEDSFPYEPTPDQLKAITEVKRDMEQGKPMDRLVCGDGVKQNRGGSAPSSRPSPQVVRPFLLAPTTVLAQQHWRTLSERFAPYPIKVALLNRFRTASERKEILKGLSDGAIDVVVGTHQLLARAPALSSWACWWWMRSSVLA